MNSRLWKLGFYAVLLAILLGGYFYSVGKDKKAAETEPESTAPTTTFTLIDKNKEDLEKIVLENSLLKNGQLTIESENKYPEEAPALALDENKLSSITGNLTYLTSEMKLEPEGMTSDSLPEYGLSPAKARGLAYFADGSSVTLNVGDLTSDQKYYYAQVDGDPALYLIPADIGERFYYTENDLADKTMPDLAADSLAYAYLHIRDEREMEFFPLPNGLVMTSPFFGREANPYSLNEYLIRPAAALAFSDLAAYGPDNLAAYGLDDPSLSLVLRDDTGEFNFLTGDDAGDGKVYAMLNDRPLIFTMDKSLLEPFYKLKPLSLINRFVTLINIESVDKIHVSEASQAYEILLTREPSGENTVLKPSVNGREVAEDKLKTYYQSLVGLSFDAEIEDTGAADPENDEPAITVTFTLNDGSPDVTCSYYDYNQDFYGVRIGEEPTVQFAVNKKSVRDMLGLLKEF